MHAKFARPLIVIAATIALCVVAYQQMTETPVLHEATQASCTPEAIKRIVNITERAIHSSKCAQPAAK
jgi:hypothetical protein